MVCARGGFGTHSPSGVRRGRTHLLLSPSRCRAAVFCVVVRAEAQATKTAYGRWFPAVSRAGPAIARIRYSCLAKCSASKIADFPTREQVRDALPRQETAYPTETRWKYSNLALVVAGEIVAASGQSYEDFVQQRILDPLGMSDTLVSTGPPQPGATELAVGMNGSCRGPTAGRWCRRRTVITSAANMTSNDGWRSSRCSSRGFRQVSGSPIVFL